MKILVTGATGLLGNNLVRVLLDRGEQVRVLLRAASDARPIEGLPVERVYGDLTDAESIQRAMTNMDAVVHSAAHIHIGWRQFETGRRVNVGGTRAVAEAARAAGIRMIHISTVDTLGGGTLNAPADEDRPGRENPPCCYIITKREAEKVVHQQIAQGLDAVIIHPGFMLGPWDWKPSSGRMLIEATKGFRPGAPSGGCTACDVRDVAAGIVQSIEQGRSGRHYILAGENLRYFDLWTMFAQVAGRRGPVFRLRPVGLFIAGRAGDLWGRITGNEPMLNSAMIAMSQRFHYYSSQRAAEELGYRFRPVRQAIEAAWQWFVERGYVRRSR